MKVSTSAAVVIAISGACVALGFFLLVFNVQILKSRIEKEKVLKKGSEAYDNWLHIPVNIYLSVYVFNLTNADDAVRGSEELVVQEIGPYVFQDHRDKIIYEDDGNTVTYLPQSLFEFVPEKSGENLTLADEITTVNIPMITTANMIHEFADKPIIVNAIKAVLKKNPNLLETRTVDEFVFGGYKAPIFESLRALQPFMQKMGIHKVIPERMAVLWDKNMTDKEGNWTIGTGAAGSQDFTQLKLWNDATTIGKWKENSTCDVPRGTDGLQFHADVKESDQLEVFIGGFCRSLKLSFDSHDDVLKVKAHKFTLNSLYDSNSDEDRCYCTESLNCDRDGVFDLGPCAQGAPIFLSKPHFLGAPFYQTNISGLTPDPLKHEGWIQVEPWLGTSLKAGIKLQLNAALAPEPALAPAVNISFARNLLPLLWIDVTNDFGEEQVQKLNSVLFHKITILRSLAASILIFGLVIAAAFFLYNKKRRGGWNLFVD